MGLLKKVQREQKDWAIRNFGPSGHCKEIGGTMSLLGAMEELGELAHAHLKESQGIRITEDHEEKAKDAIGDIIIYLADYCSRRGFNLEEIVADTWFQVKHRDWIKNKENGVVIPQDVIDDLANNIKEEIDQTIVNEIASEACRDCEKMSCTDCVHYE